LAAILPLARTHTTFEGWTSQDALGASQVPAINTKDRQRMKGQSPAAALFLT
jgi:hypothetical protein